MIIYEIPGLSFAFMLKQIVILNKFYCLLDFLLYYLNDSGFKLVNALGKIYTRILENVFVTLYKG